MVIDWSMLAGKAGGPGGRARPGIRRTGEGGTLERFEAVHDWEGWWRRVITRPGHPAQLVLTPLSWLYRLGSALKRAFFWSLPGTSTRVDAAVISVGNLTVGGSGKTPLAIEVARACARELAEPGATVILSRGYGARPSAPVLLVGEAGALLVGVEECGDEAALMTRAVPEARVVVARRRAPGARHAVEQLGAAAVVLDDGLQYWRLHRDLDMVALDGEDPFGNGRIFPAGPLREPPSALARAGVVVIKEGPAGPDGRTGLEGPEGPEGRTGLEELAARLARLAPDAALYAMHYRPVAFRRHRDRAADAVEHVAPLLRSAASGVARPAAFFRSVEALAGHPLVTRAFPDHHRFCVEDLADLPGPVVVTAKDLENLPEDPALPEIWALEVEAKVRPLGHDRPLATVVVQVLRRRVARGP